MAQVPTDPSQQKRLAQPSRPLAIPPLRKRYTMSWSKLLEIEIDKS